MEEKGFIEVKFEGNVDGVPLSPLNVDIKEIREILTDVENFLYPGKGDKDDRPLISYKIEEGSVKHYFHLPISAILLFNGLVGEIAERGNVDFLDNKRAQVIDKFQKQALDNNLTITFSNSLSHAKTLTISKATKYFAVSATYIETEFTLYGKIEAEGGVSPNFHMETKEFGRVIVSATVDQLLEGEKRLYQVYGIRATGKLSLSDNRPYDLNLVEYLEYKPTFNRTELDLLIDQASPNLSKIANVDEWLQELRGGAYA